MTKRNKNAHVHGCYARDTVLPWEDAGAFAALHQAIRQELNPVGPLEEAAVFEIAELQWRKQRLTLGFLLPYYTSMPSAELIAAAKGGLVSLANYLAEAKPAGSRTFTATGIEALDYVKARIAGKAGKAPGLPPAQSADLRRRSVIDQACDPASIERQLKVEAMIDNRIAKAFSRLIGYKEFKKLYGPTPAALPPTAAPALAPPANETPEAAPEIDTARADKAAVNTGQTRPSGWTVTKT